MKTSHFAFCAAAIALCGFAPAVAQPTEPAEPADEQVIVVEAPRALPPPAPPEEQEGRSGFTGAPTVTTTVRISALYGDLDLARPEQAARLMTRIERVSRDACAYLDRLHPLSSDPDCVGRAVANATPAAEAIIAAARQERKQEP